jgi:hypothetical protein
MRPGEGEKLLARYQTLQLLEIFQPKFGVAFDTFFAVLSCKVRKAIVI